MGHIETQVEDKMMFIEEKQEKTGRFLDRNKMIEIRYLHKQVIHLKLKEKEKGGPFSEAPIL